MDHSKVALAVLVALVVIVVMQAHSPWVHIAAGVALLLAASSAGIPLWRKRKIYVAVTIASAVAVIGSVLVATVYG